MYTVIVIRETIARIDDSYWIDLSCPDCKKKWTEDQKELRYDSVRGRVTKQGLPYKVIRK